MVKVRSFRSFDANSISVRRRQHELLMVDSPVSRPRRSLCVITTNSLANNTYCSPSVSVRKRICHFYPWSVGHTGPLRVTVGNERATATLRRHIFETSGLYGPRTGNNALPFLLCITIISVVTKLDGRFW